MFIGSYVHMLMNIGHFMKKSIVLPLFALLFASSALFASENENYEYFIDAQSLNGPTGNIETFSTRVVPRGTWSFGLHRFMGGMNYGLFGNFETGIHTDIKKVTPYTAFDSDNTERKLDEISFHTKYRLLKEGEYPIDLSAGHYRDAFYLVCGKLFDRYEFTSVQGGISWSENDVNSFFALTQSLSYQQAILEARPEADKYNFGFRFLLSPEMKLDLFLNDVSHMRNIFFDNFFFGLTITFVP